MSSRVNQVTPYGTMRWEDSYPNGRDARWTSVIDLDPRVQRTLDTQMNLSNQVGDLASSQVPRLEDHYSRPMELSSVPQIADRAYESMTARLDPRFAREEDQLRTRLHNQGLVAGGEAFNNEMTNFNAGKNDAYQQARLGAIQTMPTTYQLEAAAYNQPLNTFNALRTGAEVQVPQFQATGPGAQLFNAAQAQGQFDVNRYGIQTGGYNNMMGGLFGVGAAYAGKPGASSGGGAG